MMMGHSVRVLSLRSSIALPFLFLCFPVSICKVANHLLAQFWKIVRHYIPHDSAVYLKILMNNIVSHTTHHFPRGIRMSRNELLSEHIGSFAHDLDIFHNSIIHHVIGNKIGMCFVLGVAQPRSMAARICSSLSRSLSPSLINQLSLTFHTLTGKWSQ